MREADDGQVAKYVCRARFIVPLRMNIGEAVVDEAVAVTSERDSSTAFRARRRRGEGKTRETSIGMMAWRGAEAKERDTRLGMTAQSKALRLFARGG